MTPSMVWKSWRLEIESAEHLKRVSQSALKVLTSQVSLQLQNRARDPEAKVWAVASALERVAIEDLAGTELALMLSMARAKS